MISDKIYRFQSCEVCSQVHRLKAQSDLIQACTRCGTTFKDLPNFEILAARTIAASIGSLILFFPAMLLPILKVEQLGQRHQSSLLFGTIELFKHGSPLVGCIVLLFSIVLPLVKILALLELSYFRLLHRKLHAKIVHWVEILGRWSMLDVLLLALLVMLIKLSGLVEFQLGPAVVAFVGCVAFNMIASASFDPRGLWQNKNE